METSTSSLPSLSAVLGFAALMSAGLRSCSALFEFVAPLGAVVLDVSCSTAVPGGPGGRDVYLLLDRVFTAGTSSATSLAVSFFLDPPFFAFGGAGGG